MRSQKVALLLLTCSWCCCSISHGVEPLSTGSPLNVSEAIRLAANDEFKVETVITPQGELEVVLRLDNVLLQPTLTANGFQREYRGQWTGRFVVVPKLSASDHKRLKAMIKSKAVPTMPNQDVTWRLSRFTADLLTEQNAFHVEQCSDVPVLLDDQAKIRRFIERFKTKVTSPDNLDVGDVLKGRFLD